MGTDQLKKLKRLQKENDRLRRAVRPEHRGGRRPDGPGTGHALTFILDHLNRADQSQQLHLERIFLIPSESQTL